MKHYKSKEFQSNFWNIKPSCANVKFTIENDLAAGLVKTHDLKQYRHRIFNYKQRSELEIPKQCIQS